MSGFFQEVRRRKVYRVAAAYVVAAGFLIQIASAAFPAWELPGWSLRLVITLLLIGFPIALILAWAYDVTPQGVRATPAAATPGAHRRRNLFMLIATGVIVSAVAGFFLLPHASAHKIDKSIAVLPFQNLSADPENVFFTDGVQDEILNDLAKIADLKVISRTSVMQYKAGAKRSLRQIANELGVAHVVEGSVQRAGNRVRVSTQLIDAKTDTHLWAESYDRPLDDVFVIQSDIAKAIAAQLQAKLSPSQSSAFAAAPTRDAEAYDLFLKGEYQERQAESTYKEETYDSAETFYRQALARDPTFSLAYARLAYNRLNRHWFVKRLISGQLEEVKSDIERAIAIAPDLPDAHLALGLFHYWGRHDFDSALKEFDRAVERAAELDPRDVWIPDQIGGGYLGLRRWSDAERWLKHALALDPHHLGAAFRLNLTYIASTGDIQRARRSWEGIPNERGAGQGVRPYYIVIPEMIDERVYLYVLERHFSEALQEWDSRRTTRAAKGANWDSSACRSKCGSKTGVRGSACFTRSRASRAAARRPRLGLRISLDLRLSRT